MSSKIARNQQQPAPAVAPAALEAAGSLPAVTRNDKAMPVGLNKGLQAAWREYQRFNGALEAVLAGKTTFSVVDFLRDNWRSYTGADYPTVTVPVREVAMAIRYLIMKRGYVAAAQPTSPLFEQNMTAALAAARGTPVEQAGFGERSLQQRKYDEQTPEGQTFINLNTKEATMATKKTQQQPEDSVENVSKATEILNMAATFICSRQHTDDEIVGAVNAHHGTNAITAKKVARVRRRINSGRRAQYGFEKPKEAYVRLVRVDDKLVPKVEATAVKAAKPSSAVSRSILEKATGGAIGASKAPRPPAPAAVPKAAPKTTAKPSMSERHQKAVKAAPKVKATKKAAKSK